MAACIFGINGGLGPSVEGSSAAGYGLLGYSLTNDGTVGHTAVNATTPGAGKAGVVGYDDASNRNAFNSGVYGVSKYADGVQGRSTNGFGVYGSAIGTTTGVGVYGSSLGTGDAVEAVALGGSTATGPTSSGYALEARTYMGGVGLNIVTDTSGIFPYTGVGATITSGTLGLEINSDQLADGFAGLVINGDTSPRDCCDSVAQGAIITGYNAMSLTGSMFGLAVTGGTAIYAQGAPDSVPSTLFQGANGSGQTVALLDDRGDLTVAGKVTQHGTFTSALPSRDGTLSASYGAQTTSPSVEDIGEATLISGAARVVLDPALAKVIDVSHGYYVFLTPQGSTTGLYVSGKSTSGFTVREIGNARDSLAFDYRVVARPYGANGQRLAPINARLGLPATHAPMFYRHLKALKLNHGAIDASTFGNPRCKARHCVRPFAFDVDPGNAYRSGTRWHL